MNRLKIVLPLFLLFSIAKAQGDPPIVTVIDDFSKGHQFAHTRDAWHVFTYGTGTIGNALNQWGFPLAVDVAAGHAGLSNINVPLNGAEGGAALMLGTDNNGKHYNLNECIGGFSYQYKGIAHRFNVFNGKNLQYIKVLEASNDWVLVTIEPSDLELAPWIDADEEVDFALINVMQWDALEPGDLFQINNLSCLGDMAMTPENSLKWADVSTLFRQENYTGEPIEARVVARLLDLTSGIERTLRAERDYEVEYNNNTNIGIATAIVKGIGDYEGEVEVKFEIAELPEGGLLWSASLGELQLNTSEYDFVKNGYWYGANYRDGRISTEHGILSNILNEWNNETQQMDSDNTALTEGVGIQVLFTAKNGLWNNPSIPLIGVNWGDGATDEVNIREFGGFCLAYNLEGDSLTLELGMGEEKFPWSDYGRYIFKLEPGDRSVNISWSEFVKEYGLTRIQDAVENSTGIIIGLKNFSPETQQSLFTLREFGAYGSCSNDEVETAEYANLRILPTGGLLWKFVDGVTNIDWEDVRAQTPSVLANKGTSQEWDQGGFWFSFGWGSASVYQKNGIRNNPVKGVEQIPESDRGIQLQNVGIFVEGGVIDNNQGLQVRLVTEQAIEADDFNGATIGFNWKNNDGTAEENISAFDGLCLVYNLTGDSLNVELGWDQGKYAADEYGLYVFSLPPGNHSVNIPWSEFKHSWGEGVLDAAIEGATMFRITLPGSWAKEKQALFTLRELGSLGSCSTEEPAPADYGTDNGLVPPPKAEDIFWAKGRGDDARIIDETGTKTNTLGGYFWGFTFSDESGSFSGSETNCKYEWDPQQLDRPCFTQENFKEDGSWQVELVANPIKDPENLETLGGAGFGFNWQQITYDDESGKETTATVNIAEISELGLCLVYAMEGSATHFDLDITAHSDDYSTFLIDVPNTNGELVVKDIAWSEFYKVFGTITKEDALNTNRGLQFRLPNITEEELTAKITLVEIGKYGKCRLPAQKSDGDNGDSGGGGTELPAPFFVDSDYISETKPLAHLSVNLQMTAVNNGLNVRASNSSKLSLFNLKGNVVMQKDLSAGESFVSLKHLNSGIYIAQLKDGSQVKFLKVSK
ncbi:MAG: T9SS type A sorting domain-containing protein [Fibromonadaceae bacterium]|jgi:hypothetical protein|nr:T9SS type A sorting domain-containing protein [Fibromonadaceae bacterium]